MAGETSSSRFAMMSRGSGSQYWGDWKVDATNSGGSQYSGNWVGDGGTKIPGSWYSGNCLGEPRRSAVFRVNILAVTMDNGMLVTKTGM